MQESYQEIRVREKEEENKVFTKGLIILCVSAVLFYLLFLAFNPAINNQRLQNQGFNTTEKK